MHNVLNLLAELGGLAIPYFWKPVLIWTVIALLVQAIVERWVNGHPLVKYRLYQTLLFSLPLGALLNALTDFSFLYVHPSLAGVVQISPVAVWAMDPKTLSGGFDAAVVLPVIIGLLSMIVLLIAFAHAIRLAAHAYALAELCRHIWPVGAHEVPDRESARLIQLVAPCRDVRVAFVPEPTVPMTFGVLRPIVVLPVSAIVDPDGLRMALAHELIHIKRYDTFLHWIEELVDVAFAGWPVLRSVRRQIEAYREISCDLEVLRETRFSRSAYAHLLCSYVSPALSQTRVSLGMASSSHELERRIKAMKNVSLLHAISDVARYKGNVIAATLFLAVITIIACSDLVYSQNLPERAFTDRKPVQVTPVYSQQATQVAPGQTAPADTTKEIFVIVDQMPQFPGGFDELAKFLSTEIKYPEIARNAGIQGKVFVQFVVDANGKVRDVEVVRGIGSGLDEEAIRIVEAMPDWIPGKEDGQAVAVRFSMPITFKLGGQG